MGKFVRELETGEARDLRQPGRGVRVKSVVSERELAAIAQALANFIDCRGVQGRRDADVWASIRMILARFLPKGALTR